MRQLVDVGVSSYDRSALSPGVLHLGVGAFHRAHQELYFHELAQRGVTDWSVVGVGMRNRDLMDALEPQDNLYTVIERGSGDDEAQVIGTLDAFLHAGEDPRRVVRALADERIRMVTVTVTGNGYHVDGDTGELDADAPEVVADLEHPERPETFFGLIVEGLRRRRAAGIGPFTVVSCDNVPRNGDVSRTAVVSFARLRGEHELAGWIERHVAFPNSMVDRITPEADGAATELLEDEFGVHDNSPVATEPFRQWILEDSFCNERPPLEQVGVQFVEDVAPYELMKKRLLNGSHTALGYLGVLAGVGTTDEAMADPVFRRFLVRLMDEEVSPLLPQVPGVNLEEYRSTLIERFSNPSIKDDLQRLCRRGSTKVPAYLVAAIVEARAAGRSHELLTLAVAGWLRYLRGDAFDGGEIAIQDARKDELQPLLRRDLLAALEDRTLFGDLSGDEGFAQELEAALGQLEALGARGAVERAVTS
jgi:fructuronate reductase/mannitol 2-dehydrogenase